jgi:hypothetical protein
MKFREYVLLMENLQIPRFGLDDWQYAKDWLEQHDHLPGVFAAFYEQVAEPWLAEIPGRYREAAGKIQKFIRRSPKDYAHNVEFLARRLQTEGGLLLDEVRRGLGMGWSEGRHLRMVAGMQSILATDRESMRRELHRRRLTPTTGTQAGYYWLQPTLDASWQDDKLPKWVRQSFNAFDEEVNNLETIWRGIIPILVQVENKRHKP